MATSLCQLCTLATSLCRRFFDDDQDVMIVGEGEMSPEDVLREMQRLAETYETAEEEIALEALLQSYEP